MLQTRNAKRTGMAAVTVSGSQGMRLWLPRLALILPAERKKTPHAHSHNPRASVLDIHLRPDSVLLCQCHSLSGGNRHGTREAGHTGGGHSARGAKVGLDGKRKKRKRLRRDGLKLGRF